MKPDERRSSQTERELQDYASSGAFRAADDDDTHPGVPLGSLPPLPSDVHEALGTLMAATARNGRHIASTKRDMGVIRTEVTGLRKDVQDVLARLEEDRGALVHESSTAAAKKSSNRAALVMGSCVAVWEVASPYLHELWRLIHK